MFYNTVNQISLEDFMSEPSFFPKWFIPSVCTINNSHVHIVVEHHALHKLDVQLHLKCFACIQYHHYGTNDGKHA